jgi:hypothetical protein
MQVNALSAYALLANMADPWLNSPLETNPEGGAGASAAAQKEVWLANTAGGSLLGRHLMSIARAKYSQGPLRVRVVAVVRRAAQKDSVLAAGCAQAILLYARSSLLGGKQF